MERSRTVGFPLSSELKALACCYIHILTMCVHVHSCLSMYACACACVCACACACVLTNNDGRKLIVDFNIIKESWHLSDHLPLNIEISLRFSVNADVIFKRSCELKSFIPSQQPLIKTSFSIL